MPSSTLGQVHCAVANNIADETLRTSVVDFLAHYKKQQWISTAILVRKFGCSLAESYRILHEMEEYGILKSFFEIVCPRCRFSLAKVEVFNEIPDSAYCEHCDAEFFPVGNSRIIFKVMRDVG